MKNETIVGLDIGTTKIACFVGQKQDNGKVKILGYGKCDSLGVERGVVINIKLASESITRAVNMAADRSGYDIHEVYVGVAGQHIKSKNCSGSIMIPADHPYILEEDVEQLTQQQYGINLQPGEEIIHLFPQTYYVDGVEIHCDPVGVKGNKLECVFHMVTGNRHNLECITHSVQNAGLLVKDLVLEPVASSLATLDSTDMEAGVALVDIGGGTTDIAVFKEGVIRHTSVLPLAGNVITDDIREGCNVMRHQAEALKTRFGSCMPSQLNEGDYVSIPVYRNSPEREINLRILAGIIKARTQTILEQVSYEIKESCYEKQLIGGLVLTGGGAKLKHIKDFAAFETGFQTRIGMPNEHLTDDNDAEINHPMYATSIGLVLYGIEKSEAEQNPEDEVIEEPIAPAPNPTSEMDLEGVEQVNGPDKEGDKPEGKKKTSGWAILQKKVEDFLSKTIKGDDSYGID